MKVELTIEEKRLIEALLYNELDNYKGDGTTNEFMKNLINNLIKKLRGDENV